MNTIRLTMGQALARYLAAQCIDAGAVLGAHAAHSSSSAQTPVPWQTSHS